jgi:hypothetical protein
MLRVGFAIVRGDEMRIKLDGDATSGVVESNCNEITCLEF